MRTFRSARTIFWAQLPPPSVGGLRRRGPVTCGFAGSRPAPSRRPRAVSSGCGGARHRAPSAGVQGAPGRRILSSCPCSPPSSLPACFLQRRPSSPSASDADIHSRSSTALTGCSGPDRSPSERSPGLPSSPSAPRHEVPGFGAVGLPVRLAPGTVAPVLPRVSARQPEPTAGWRDWPRPRSLLAANQWIAEASAVVEPILRGPSPQSLPIESLLVPEARRSRDRRGGEKTWSLRQTQGQGGDSGLEQTRP